MENMDEVTNEVKIMLGMPVEGDAAPPPEGMRFGAKDVNDLSWKKLDGRLFMYGVWKMYFRMSG